MAHNNPIVGYNIAKNQWITEKSTSGVQIIENYYLSYQSCMFHQDKSYERYLILILIINPTPAGAPIGSFFVRKSHAIHHFYGLFELISTV